MTAWPLLTLVTTAAACAFAVIAWRQHQDTRRRSDARVAALAAAVDGPLEAFSVEGGLAEAGVAAAGLETGNYVQTMPARRGGVMAAGMVPIALVVVALLVTRGPRAMPAPPVARQPETLELLDMRHDRSGDLLTVTGTVRVRGRDTAPVTAVVTGRAAAGHVVVSAHAPLDDASLDVGGESSFRVSVSGGHDVRRYQVRFETPLGPLTHIDRRAHP